MDFELLRYNHDKESSQGLLAVDDDFKAFTLEDERREQKVSGDTRIPEGRYKVGIRKELTPLTKKYRGMYPWFEYHIEIQGIPNFRYVYIHVGNDEGHTEACVLIADTAMNDPNDYSGRQWQSAQAFARFYQAVYPRLKNGEECWINVHSIWPATETKVAA